jgi:cytochrome c5
MRCRIFISLALICLLLACAAAWAQTGAKPSQNNSKPKSAPAAQAPSSEGEKRFQTNCGRCHNPPEDISPREARAVVRHMRVRAMLSAEDEKFILEYLAP